MTEYDRALLPNQHLAALEKDVHTEEDWRKRTGYSIGYPGWGLLYYLALCRLDPEQESLIVETGTNVGASAIVLAQALNDSAGRGLLRTVEIDPTLHTQAQENIAKAGLTDLVETYLGDSLEVLPDMIASQSVQMAFLDGSHKHDHVVREFELLHPYLANDSIVIMDNTYPIAEPGEDARVYGGLHTIVSRFGGNLINLPYCSWFTPGMAVWQQEPFSGFTRRVHSASPLRTMP